VTINPFTNTSAGTIKGSVNDGQVFAENDGTGSVNGWDNLSNNVSTNTSNIAALQAAIPTVNDATLTIQNNGTNVATFTANSATNTTANIVSPVDIGSVLSTPSDVAYVNSNNIISNAVTTSKIANGAVTSDKVDWTTIGTTYSTNEVDTHDKWINGKTIYLKVFTGTLTNAANEDRYIQIWSSSPIDELIDVGGWYGYGNDGERPLPYSESANELANVYLQTGSGNLMYRLYSQTAITDRPYKFWVKYTKN
jgi:hypothetical protein